MCPQHIWDIGLAVPPIPLTFLIMMSFISGIPCKKICQDHPVVHLWKHWKKGRVQVSILCIHCTIIMDLINSAAILWIYMFFFFVCFFVVFFLTTTLSTSLQAGIITLSTFSKAFQKWRYCQFELYQASGMNFMNCPCCFNAQLACHKDRNGKTYCWKKSECISSFIPLFTVRTVLKVFINLKTYNFCYTVF